MCEVCSFVHQTRERESMSERRGWKMCVRCVDVRKARVGSGVGRGVGRGEGGMHQESQREARRLIDGIHGRAALVPSTHTQDCTAKSNH